MSGADARAAAASWPVPVTDVADRDRTLHVILRGVDISIVLPPGEGCSMTPYQVRVLDAALDAAVDVAEAETERRRTSTNNRRAGVTPHHITTPGTAATTTATEAGIPAAPDC